MPQTRRKTPTIRSRKRIEFIDVSPEFRGLIPHRGAVFGEAMKTRVREGTILYVQCWNEHGREYGLIPGFVSRRQKKRRAKGTAMINPLTRAGEKKYTKKFRKLLKGTLNFW